MRPRRPRAALTIAAVIVLITLVAAFYAQRTAWRGEDRDDRARAQIDTIRFEVRLVLAGAVIDSVASRSDDPTSFATASDHAMDTVAFAAIGLVDANGHVRSVAGPHPAPLDGRDLTDHPVLDTLLQSSLDVARERVTGPVTAGDLRGIAVAAPVLPAGASQAAPRDRNFGWVVGLLDAASLRDEGGLFSDGLWPGAKVVIQGPEGTVLDTNPGKVVSRESFIAGGRPWRVTVGVIPGGEPVIGWWVLAGGLAASALAYVALIRLERARGRAEATAGARGRQLEVIAETSAGLQQSLDLADLLPAFAVTIRQEFGLTSVSIEVDDGTGTLTEVFRLGEHGAGAIELVGLRRAGRVVGQLCITSPLPLDELTKQTLQSLADLLAVAISNAELFKREQQAASRLRELDTMKNAFLGTVSHELRTSTTAVQGFADLLAERWDDLDDIRKRELAARMRRQSGSLRHLVDDLLDFARLESARLRVHPRDIELDGHVWQLLESMSPLLGEHEVVAEIEPVRAWVDPVAVERILANLLSNASKYSPPGTQIKVAVSAVGDRSRLVVADMGPGIPEEERRKVFVRFYRLSNAETLRTRGAGIGLSILSDFAQQSGATVTIDDAPGGGARVTVDFPTAPQAAPVP